MKIFFIKIFLLFVVLLGTNHNCFAQCGIYDFYSPDTIPFCAPDVAKFQVVNMPTGSTYEWDVGNGFAASNGSPTYFFDTAGSYTIRLRITFTNNTKCVITKTNYIKTSSPKIPQLSIDTSLFCSDNDTSVQIKDLTVGSISRNYYYNWDYIKNATNPFKIDFKEN